MNSSMRLVASLLMLVALAATMSAQSYLFPAFGTDGRAAYQVAITLPRANVSGVCVLVNSNDTIKGTLVNEFGVRAFSFWVAPDRHKVKLRDVMPMLNKWYIRRVLAADLKHLFNATQAQVGVEHKHRRVDLLDDQQGGVALTNTRRNITYQFEPLNYNHATD